MIKHYTDTESAVDIELKDMFFKDVTHSVLTVSEVFDIAWKIGGMFADERDTSLSECDLQWLEAMEKSFEITNRFDNPNNAQRQNVIIILHYYVVRLLESNLSDYVKSHIAMYFLQVMVDEKLIDKFMFLNLYKLLSKSGEMFMIKEQVNVFIKRLQFLIDTNVYSYQKLLLKSYQTLLKKFSEKVLTK